MSASTRRQFLTRAGAAAAGALTGILTVSGSAAATHFEERPGHVQVDFPENVLEQYKPHLVSYHLDYEPSDIFAWRARSGEHETDALVYWAEYEYQEGIGQDLGPWGRYIKDSHFGDHEPFYAFIDSDTGEPVQYNGSVYHWMNGTFYPEALTFTDEHRPRLKPVNPWHQYTPTVEVPENDFTLKDLGDAENGLKSWLADDDFHGHLHPGACNDPWQMQSRESWWSDQSFWSSWNARMVSTLAWMSQNFGLDIAGFSQSYTENAQF